MPVGEEEEGEEDFRAGGEGRKGRGVPVTFLSATARLKDGWLGSEEGSWGGRRRGGSDTMQLLALNLPLEIF